MNKAYRLFTLLVLVLASPSLWGQTAKPPLEAIPNTILALPSPCGVKLRWVLPPTPGLDILKSRISSNFPCFSIDKFQNPWIGLDQRRLLSPVTKFQCVLSEPLQTFTHLDNGALFFATVRALGYMGIDESTTTNASGVPVVPFQTITPLPQYFSRMYKGARDCLYFVSGDSSAGTSTVFLLQPEKPVAGNPSAGSRIQRFQRLLETEEPITAVAGDGDTTILAFGKLVIRFNRVDGNMSPWPTQPTEDILDLTYSPTAGLFYSSASGVGFLGNTRMFRFLESPSPRIFLRDQALYVLFPKTLGIVAFENIDALRAADVPLKGPAADSGK